jgi:hypothetical protein
MVHAACVSINGQYRLLGTIHPNRYRDLVCHIGAGGVVPANYECDVTCSAHLSDWGISVARFMLTGDYFDFLVHVGLVSVGGTVGPEEVEDVLLHWFHGGLWHGYRIWGTCLVGWVG